MVAIEPIVVFPLGFLEMLEGGLILVLYGDGKPENWYTLFTDGNVVLLIVWYAGV